MKFFNWLFHELGFNKDTAYQKQYLNETNIRTGIYMSFIVIVLELWMLIRYVYKRPGRTFFEYFDGENNYLILFSAALVIFIFAVEYSKSFKLKTVSKLVTSLILATDTIMIIRFIMNNQAEMSATQLLVGLKYYILLFILAGALLLYELGIFPRRLRKDVYGQFLNVLFAIISVGFGVETSLYDITKERQILCFMTMALFVVCMLIWKPYVSFIILGLTFLYFYSLWVPHLAEIDAAGGKAMEGDTINFFMFWIVMVMVSFSIYHQRRLESAIDESLLEANESLNRAATTDDLTGIRNMFYFNQETVEVLNDPNIDPGKKIFLFLNVENFKTYNDQYGYQEGNKYLKEMAELVKESFKDEPVARQSDDHFVVLTDIEGVSEKIEKVRGFVHNEDSDIYLELKTGAYRPVSRDVDPRVAIDYARYACSLIKNKFNRNYKEYDRDTDEYFHKNQYIVNHIDRAVQKGYIKVYYQPVVWSDNKELCGLEALARWIDPKYGFLSPGVFVPVLEEHRLIHKLDACIFEQVCRDLRDGMDAGRTVVPVSLNFSRLDFELMDAAGLIEELTDKYDIPRDYIHVEITESAMSENMSLLNEAIDRFHENGFSLWLDDFGSGYSSLNVLKDYSFDVLKIDMKFLTNFENNEKARTILNTIISLADGIGMKTLTEGVETEEAAQFLCDAGCGRLQGFLFGKPMPLEELIPKIADGSYKVSEKFN
ncbi:MAG: GGDEF domain-containing phosphodiesterase [Lachnospiraceae bacterium]|nr:GGDEF domain-containing phosphodiesterase [Lachnospiraceae bacterium]